MSHGGRDSAGALLPASPIQSQETQTKKESVMKRFHVHVSVDDLDASVRFYSTVFGAPPTVLKPDYAKWMMEDPRINFAISKRGLKAGVDHLGVQVESETELASLREQMATADISVLDQPQAECCYARSDKYWITDPQGVAWETFHTLDSIRVYGYTERTEGTACCSTSSKPSSESAKSGACCA
jgi:catechol 2,3-dioxygenase-like lactoylglutathione lyase family enzyme